VYPVQWSYVIPTLRNPHLSVLTEVRASLLPTAKFTIHSRPGIGQYTTTLWRNRVILKDTGGSKKGEKMCKTTQEVDSQKRFCMLLFYFVNYVFLFLCLCILIVMCVPFWVFCFFSYYILNNLNCSTLNGFLFVFSWTPYQLSGPHSFLFNTFRLSFPLLERTRPDVDLWHSSSTHTIRFRGVNKDRSTFIQISPLHQLVHNLYDIEMHRWECLHL